MKKLFFDTNLWLRFFLKDNETQYKYVLRLFSLVDEGAFRSYTSSLVFLELNFVMQRIYKLSIAEIYKYFEEIKNFRNITILEKTNFKEALNYYKKYKIKFSDCLIASQIKKDITLVTFDKELFKIKELPVKNPKEVLELFYPVRKYTDKDLKDFLKLDKEENKKLEKQN